MDLFKERLKIVWIGVKGLLISLAALIAGIIVFGLIAMHDILFKIVSGAFFSVLGLGFLFLVVVGICWLFVEPFRKTKEDK